MKIKVKYIFFSIENDEKSNPHGSGNPVRMSTKGNPVATATDNGMNNSSS